jgi:hypothetical protein
MFEATLLASSRVNTGGTNSFKLDLTVIDYSGFFSFNVNNKLVILGGGNSEVCAAHEMAQRDAIYATQADSMRADNAV